jgi:hypothetical protein
MFDVKLIKVCKKCSGLDVNELKAKLSPHDYSIGCIHKCSRKHPELKGKVVGLYKGELVVCETRKEFWERTNL